MARKKTPDKAELEHHLIHLKMSVKEYSSLSGVSCQRIYKLIKKYKINRQTKIPIPSRKEFLEKLNDLGSGVEVARYYMVSSTTVSDWAKKMDIDLISAKRSNDKKRPDDDTLYQWYVMDEMTIKEISERLNKNRKIVSEWLKEAEIETRFSNYRVLEIDKMELADDLHRKDMSYKKISEKHDISLNTLLRFRKEHGFY